MVLYGAHEHGRLFPNERGAHGGDGARTSDQPAAGRSGAAAVLIPTALIAWRGLDLASAPRRFDSAVDRSLKVYLGFVVIGPVAIAAFIGALGGGLIKDQWLIAYLLAAPALVVILLVPHGVEVGWRKSAAVFYVVCLAVLAIAYPVEREAHYWRANGRPVLWAPLMPAEPMAEAGQALWRKAVAAAGKPDMPIRIVAGGPEAAGVANVTPGRPAWFEHFHLGILPGSRRSSFAVRASWRPRRFPPITRKPMVFASQHRKISIGGTAVVDRGVMQH